MTETGDKPKPSTLLRELEDTVRRIDNMHYLLGFKEKRRDEIVAELQAVLERTEAQTTFIDFDARRDPKTKTWCIMCQKDLDPEATKTEVRLIMKDSAAAPYALRAADEILFNLGVLTTDGQDYGRHAIGSDCAKKLGKEWVLPRKVAVPKKLMMVMKNGENQ